MSDDERNKILDDVALAWEDSGEYAKKHGLPYSELTDAICDIYARLKRHRDDSQFAKRKRAYTLTVEIGGDNWEAVMNELENLSFHIAEHGPECKSVGGGCDSGHIVTITHDPEMTNERYFELIRKHLEREP